MKRVQMIIVTAFCGLVAGVILHLAAPPTAVDACHCSDNGSGHYKCS